MVLHAKRLAARFAVYRKPCLPPHTIQETIENKTKFRRRKNMRAEETDKWNISICGLNCTKCDIYMASHGDEKLRTEIVEWFTTKRNKNIKPEQIICEGCRSSSDDQWSSDCKMMLCARKRGLQYCFQCNEFPFPSFLHYHFSAR